MLQLYFNYCGYSYGPVVPMGLGVGQSGFHLLGVGKGGGGGKLPPPNSLPPPHNILILNIDTYIYNIISFGHGHLSL